MHASHKRADESDEAHQSDQMGLENFWRQPVPWVGRRCDAAYLDRGHGDYTIQRRGELMTSPPLPQRTRLAVGVPAGFGRRSPAVAAVAAAAGRLAPRLPRVAEAEPGFSQQACTRAFRVCGAFGIDMALPHHAAERGLDVRARAAEPVVEVEMAEGGVHVVAPQQPHHPAAEPDAFGVAGRAADQRAPPRRTRRPGCCGVLGGLRRLACRRAFRRAWRRRFVRTPEVEANAKAAASIAAN